MGREIQGAGSQAARRHFCRSMVGAVGVALLPGQAAVAVSAAWRGAPGVIVAAVQPDGRLHRIVDGLRGGESAVRLRVGVTAASMPMSISMRYPLASHRFWSAWQEGESIERAPSTDVVGHVRDGAIALDVASLGQRTRCTLPATPGRYLVFALPAGSPLPRVTDFRFETGARADAVLRDARGGEVAISRVLLHVDALRA